MREIYLDNAASTRVAEEVATLMTEVMRTAWGNPSSKHAQGAAARAYLATARSRLLTALGDRDGARSDIVWTSGCTEANALAVIGAMRTRPGTLVISTIEHAAIATLADRFEAEGRPVVRVAPGPGGVLDPDAVAAAARDAAVVALVAVQNELGVVQPVAALANAVRAVAPAAHIHVDGAQAVGKIPLDFATLSVDSLALAGHKLHGPKGVGALQLRRGARLEPLWVGGGQQHGLRGGTQDVPGAAGLGLAAELATTTLPSTRVRWLELASRVTEILDARHVAYTRLVPDQRRVPHILTLGVHRVSASALRERLADRGICVSTGSACAEGETKASSALAAIGLPSDDGMLRLSFGLDTTLEEVTTASQSIADVIGELARR
jgi:cysteine desulfurase